VTNEMMKRKIIAIGIICTFLLTALFSASAIGMKVEAAGWKPDLRVTNVIVPLEPVDVNTQVECQWTIENIGADCQDSFNVYVFLNGDNKPAGGDRIYGLKHGESFTCDTFKLWAFDRGMQKVHVYVDYTVYQGGEIDEENESNNDMLKTFWVGKARSRNLPSPKPTVLGDTFPATVIVSVKDRHTDQPVTTGGRVRAHRVGVGVWSSVSIKSNGIARFTGDYVTMLGELWDITVWSPGYKTIGDQVMIYPDCAHDDKPTYLTYHLEQTKSRSKTLNMPLLENLFARLPLLQLLKLR